MIHAIYVKNRPKSKWRLFSTTFSAETAALDCDDALLAAKKEGNEEAEVAIQIFDTTFFIPEHLDEVKKHKPLYN